jgi:hypothetical protein
MLHDCGRPWASASGYSGDQGRCTGDRAVKTGQYGTHQRDYAEARTVTSLLWHHRDVSSHGLDHLAQTAYEAHRGSHSDPLPPWEEAAKHEQQAWKAAVSAVAAQTGTTLTDTPAVPMPVLEVDVDDRRCTYQAEFTAGRQGSLVIMDDYASNQHARFQIAHGSWYVKDLGSTNGTSLNGRRIHAAQRLKKGDKIKIGHTVVTVVSA